MRSSPVRPVAAALLLLFIAGCGSRATGKDPRVLSDGAAATVSLREMGEKPARFFTYVSSSGRRVKFLIYRDSHGTYRAVLDACRKCFRWRKGYAVEEEYVVCRKCGERFELDSLHDGRGSCVPVPLTSSLQGEMLSIPVSELEAGEQYF